MAKRNSSGGLSKSSMILLLLMLVIGCMVAYGVYSFMNSQRSIIYVFNQPYEAGTQVTTSMFVAQEIDTSTYNQMASVGGVTYATATEIQNYLNAGDKLVSDVVTAQPVLTNCFVSTGGTGVDAKLASDMVSVEIPAALVSGLSGNEVRQGSRVNVSSGYSVGNDKETDLLFQDLLVLDVLNDADGYLTSIFVELTPADSIIMQHALSFEKVSVAVLKPGSYTAITGDTTYRKAYSKDDDAVTYNTPNQQDINQMAEPYTETQAAQ